MATAAEELDVDGIAVRFTNPDKVYFPKLGSAGTKGKLMEYYLAVAAPMVALLRDRPTHLQRFPDGIDGEEIYQKRVPAKHPDYLETCTVTFPSGRTADALKVTHPSAIAWAAQMGTVTLHPWQVRCPDTEHPDELRVDLDPQPGTAFKEASAIAVDVLKPMLDELGPGRLSEDLGRARRSRVRPDQAGLGLRRRAPGRHRAGPRGGAPRPGRGDHVVVEGGARQSGSSSTTTRTPAIARSRRRTRRAAPRSPRCPLRWAGMNWPTPTPTTTPSPRCRTWWPSATDPWADIDAVAHSIEPLLEMFRADEERGLGDLPYPPNYPKMPGEPPRVQPSKKVAANWDDEDNPA